MKSPFFFGIPVLKTIHFTFGALFCMLFYTCQKEPGAVLSHWNTTVVEVCTFGGSLNDSAKAVVATSDGGFAVLGHTQSEDGLLLEKGNNSFDFWLLRFDEKGALLWHKTYGGLGDDRGTDLVLRPEGGFVMLGSFESVIDGESSVNLGLVAVDEEGVLLWEKAYGYKGSDYGTKLIATSEGGYLIVGVLDVTASKGLGNQIGKHAGGDFWVIKVDSQGALQWRNYFGGLQSDTPYGVAEDKDGGFWIVGTTDSIDTDISQNLGSYDAWVVRLDRTGKKIWERTLGGAQIDAAYDIVLTTDGSALVLGDSRSPGQTMATNRGGADLWIWRLSPRGELVAEQNFGGSNFDVGRAVFPLSNQQWLICGSSRSVDGDLSINNGQNDAWTLVLSQNTERIEWQQTIGGSQIEFLNDAAELANGTLVSVGETNSNDAAIVKNQGFNDLLLILNLKQ